MKHDFFQHALGALISDLSTKLAPYTVHLGQKFPILIMNTGDEVFLSNLHPNERDLYTSIPRMVLDLEGFSILADQLSNPHVFGSFVDEDTVTETKSAKVSNFRRIPIEFPVSCQVYFSNIFQFFLFSEILMMQTYKNNVYSFSYVNKHLKGSYSYVDSLDTVTNKTLAFDSDKRQRILNLTFNVELQYPAFDYYNSKSILDGANSIQSVQHKTYLHGQLVGTVQKPQDLQSSSD